MQFTGVSHGVEEPELQRRGIPLRIRRPALNKTSEPAWPSTYSQILTSPQAIHLQNDL